METTKSGIKVGDIAATQAFGNHPGAIPLFWTDHHASKSTLRKAKAQGVDRKTIEEIKSSRTYVRHGIDFQVGDQTRVLAIIGGGREEGDWDILVKVLNKPTYLVISENSLRVIGSDPDGNY